jgi:hypothetical protein
VNPVLALALVAAAGIAVTHLPLPRLRRNLSLDQLLAAGAPLVLLGLLLGPGLGVLDRSTLRAVAPATALGIGWIGAVVGARLEWRVLRRMPRHVWRLAGVHAVAALGLTAVTAWGLTRVVPALAAAWRPTLPAVLTLAAAAMVSGPSAVALVTKSKALGRAALLDTALGAGAFALALALYHPRDPSVGPALGRFSWVAVSLAASGGVGVLFLWLARLRADHGELGLDLLGAMLLGAGVGYAAGLSPFVVCALAMALIVNLSPQRRQVQGLLEGWEHAIYAVVLVIAGALLHLPTLWLLPAALVLGVVRVAARWAPIRYTRAWLTLPDLPPHLGLANVAQGGVAVALGLSFTLAYGGSGTLLTTLLLGVGLAQAAAGPLRTLAQRPAREEVR